jgi:type I restriction enzyme, S subunit
MSEKGKVPSKKYQLLHWVNSYGAVPDDWQFRRFGELFEERSEFSTDQATYPLYSFTIDRGVTEKTDRYERSFLLKDAETNEYKIVRQGDLIFNPMNIRFGAIDLYCAEKPVSVSAYYTIATPLSSDVDPRFLRPYLKSAHMLDLYHRIAIGSLIEKRRVHWSLLRDMYIPMPPLADQKRIADILCIWDRAIATVEQLIANSEAQTRWLTQELLSGNIRVSTSGEEGWTSHDFGDIASVSKERLDPKTSQIPQRCVELEHLESSTGRLLGCCDAREQDSIKAVFQPSDVLFGKLRPYLRKSYLADFHGVCSTEIWVLKANLKICDPYYLAWLVRSEPFHRAVSVSAGSKMPRAEWEVVRDAAFWMPPKEEQRTIAELLFSADRLTNAYRTTLENLVKEKAALAQQLLTGDRQLQCNGKTSDAATVMMR